MVESYVIITYQIYLTKSPAPLLLFFLDVVMPPSARSLKNIMSTGIMDFE